MRACIALSVTELLTTEQIFFDGGVNNNGINKNGVNKNKINGNNGNAPPLPASVDIKQLPETLPPAVAALQSAVVTVQTPTTINAPGGFLSGVILDKYHVLTAGHGFRTDTGELIPLVGCLGDIYIAGRDAKGNFINTNSSKIVSSFDGVGSSTPDVSLIETQQPLADSDNLALVRPNIHHLKNGTPLYFINWEPASHGISRDPFSNNPQLNRPAIFGGTVFTKWKGDTVVRVGEKNYGKGIPDTVIHDGASGGGVFVVFNNKAYLYGISNDSASNGEEAFVQPITHPLLAGLYNRLKYKPDACKSLQF